MRKLWIGLLTLALGAGVAIAPNVVEARRGHDHPPPVEPRPWFVDETKLPFEPLPGAEAMWGVIDGAGYRIEIPENWNKELVVWAHGFRGDGLELTVDNHPLRAHLIAEGYAWAASSYAKNGYVPGQGAIDSAKLISHFGWTIQWPWRTYMTGASMGGHVTAYAVQSWPWMFAGAMPICGVMGDSDLFDYFQDSYLLAEYFAGNEVVVPTPEDYYSGGTWLETLGKLGPGFPFVLNEQGEKYKSAIEQLTGGERPIFDEGWVGNVGGAFPFFFQSATTDTGRQNKRTVYQIDSDPALSDEEAMLNDLIPRIKAPRQYRQKRGINPIPGTENDSPYINGRIRRPVMSLHTLGELFVPFHMQQIYAERVAKKNKSRFLVQRAIRDTGHCGFDPSELVAAFDDLVVWVEDGVRPGGDDVLDPVAVADPNFGCAYTLVDREGLPPCPVP